MAAGYEVAIERLKGKFAEMLNIEVVILFFLLAVPPRPLPRRWLWLLLVEVGVLVKELVEWKFAVWMLLAKTVHIETVKSHRPL